MLIFKGQAKKTALCSWFSLHNLSNNLFFSQRIMHGVCSKQKSICFSTVSIWGLRTAAPFFTSLTSLNVHFYTSNYTKHLIVKSTFTAPGTVRSPQTSSLKWAVFNRFQAATPFIKFVVKSFGSRKEDKVKIKISFQTDYLTSS